MALDAAQIEILRNGIGDALTFGDLDLVLRKCFGGDARINEITAATRPTRQIAQECIELVEQEKVTVVFLRFILITPKCPPKLRQDAITIFPELRSVDLPFADIVTSAADNLQMNANVIAEKVASKAPIQLLTDSISELKCYKNLHEALHQIQISGRPQVPDEDDARGQQEFRRDLRQYVAQLRTSRIKADDALSEMPPGSALRVTEQPWITTVGDCAVRLQAALTATDVPAAELALDVTARAIDPLPEQINKHIFEIAKKLPLDGLLDALRMANGAEIPNSPVKQAIDAIGALRLALLTRVLEHSRWQETDNALFSLSQAFRQAATTAFRKFARQWPPAKKQIDSLTGSDAASEWAVTIKGYSGDVDHALAEVERSFAAPPVAGNDDRFNSVMSEPYDALRLEAQTRFFSVDSALKQSCLELLRIQTPLATISAGMTS
jgi:hypothetical protein